MRTSPRTANGSIPRTVSVVPVAQATLSYPIHTHTLDNGLRVIASPDHSTPTVAVNIWYGVGSRHEQPGKTGFAHLFEHVMFQGSRQVASGDHIGLLQAAGASVNATTWFDRTNYFETLPTGGLELALWLEADRLGTLLDALTQQNLDNQREVVKEEKRQRYDNVPYGDAIERLIELTFPGDHPYGHTVIGSMADLNSATVTDVAEFFNRYYVPANAVLSIVGDCSAEHAFSLAERYFGELERRPKAADPEMPPLPGLTGQPTADVTAAVPADAVYLTWRLPAVGTPDLDALELGLAVLGDGQSSRLHRQLVRNDELADATSASAMGLIGGTSLGLAYARARDGIAIERVRDGVQAEIEKLVTSGVTEQELDRAKAQFERGWLHELARIDSRADTFGEHATLFGDADLVNERLARTSAIGAEAVSEALQLVTPTTSAVLTYRKEQA